MAPTRKTTACWMLHCRERATSRVTLVIEGATIGGVLLCPTHLATLHALVADGYDIKIGFQRPVIPAQRAPTWQS